MPLTPHRRPPREHLEDRRRDSGELDPESCKHEIDFEDHLYCYRDRPPAPQVVIDVRCRLCGQGGSFDATPGPCDVNW